MREILHHNKSVSLLTTAIFIAASFMISLLIFTDYINQSSIRIIHYLFLTCLIAYLIYIFCKTIITTPKFNQIHNLKEYIDKDEQRIELQRKTKIKDKRILETLTKFEDYVIQISKHRNEQRITHKIQDGAKKNYSSYRKNPGIIELINNSDETINFQVMEKQRQLMFSYSENDTLINKMTNIMKENQIFRKRTKENIDNDRQLTGIIDVDIKKQNMNQAFEAIRTEITSLLQSTIFIDYSRIFTHLSSIFQKYFNLRLSSHSSQKITSITQLRKAIKIYQQKKCFPSKFRQNIINNIDRQTVDGLKSLLKSIPDFQRYDSFRLSFCLLCISNLYPQQVFLMIDSNGVETTIRNKQLQYGVCSYQFNSAKTHHQPHKIYMLSSGYMKYEGFNIKQIDTLLLRLLIKISKNYFRIQNSLHKAMRILMISQNEKNYEQLDNSRIGKKNPFENVRN